MNPIEAAESALIGTLLRHPEQVRAVSWLQPADFSEGGRADVFAVIRGCVTAGQPVDPVRITDELRARYTDWRTRGHNNGAPAGALGEQPTHPSLVDATRLHSMLALAGNLGHADPTVYGRMVLEASLRREIRGLGVEVSAAALGEPATAPARVMAAAENLTHDLDQLHDRWRAATDIHHIDTTEARRLLARLAIERDLTHARLRGPLARGLSSEHRALLAELADAARAGSDQELTRKAGQVAEALQASTDGGVAALGRDAARSAAALRGDRAALEWVVAGSGPLSSAYETLLGREAGHDTAIADLDTAGVRVQAIPDTTSSEPGRYWVTVAHLPHSHHPHIGDDDLAPPHLTRNDAAALRAHYQDEQRIAGLAVVDRRQADSALDAAAEAVAGPDGRVHNELLYGGERPGPNTIDAVSAVLEDTTHVLARVHDAAPAATPPTSERTLTHQRREAAAQRLARADRPTRDKVRAAERQLIAAALTTGPGTLTDRLEPGDFSSPDTAATWAAISALHDSGQPVNLVTVAWEQQRNSARPQGAAGLPVDELHALTDVAPVGVDDAADLIAAHRVYQVAETVRTNFDAIAKHPGVTIDGLVESGLHSARAVHDLAHRLRPAYGDVSRAADLIDQANALPGSSNDAEPAAVVAERAHRVLAVNGRTPAGRSR